MQKQSSRGVTRKKQLTGEQVEELEELELEGEAPKELPTELAFGTDGLIYVSAERMEPGMLEGRAVFQGYALTPEETKLALDEIHQLACNVTIAVRLGMNRKKKATR